MVPDTSFLTTGHTTWIENEQQHVTLLGRGLTCLWSTWLPLFREPSQGGFTHAKASQHLSWVREEKLLFTPSNQSFREAPPDCRERGSELLSFCFPCPHPWSWGSQDRRAAFIPGFWLGVAFPAWHSWFGSHRHAWAPVGGKRNHLFSSMFSFDSKAGQDTTDDSFSELRSPWRMKLDSL